MWWSFLYLYTASVTSFHVPQHVHGVSGYEMLVLSHFQATPVCEVGVSAPVLTGFFFLEKSQVLIVWGWVNPGCQFVRKNSARVETQLGTFRWAGEFTNYCTTTATNKLCYSNTVVSLLHVLVCVIQNLMVIVRITAIKETGCLWGDGQYRSKATGPRAKSSLGAWSVADHTCWSRLWPIFLQISHG